MRLEFEFGGTLRTLLLGRRTRKDPEIEMLRPRCPRPVCRAAKTAGCTGSFSRIPHGGTSVELGARPQEKATSSQTLRVFYRPPAFEVKTRNWSTANTSELRHLGYYSQYNNTVSNCFLSEQRLYKSVWPCRPRIQAARRPSSCRPPPPGRRRWPS